MKIPARSLFRLASALALSVWLLMPAADAQTRAPLSPPVKVRLGIISALFDSGSLIALEKGYFREEGLDVEVKTFASSSDANQALSIGSLDVLSSGVSAALFNSKLRNIQMSIVASAGSNTPGHGMISLVLRKDLVESGRYKTPADLKGMKLATGITAPSHWMVQEMAREAGLGPKDVEYVSLGISNTVAAMTNKGIEGGSVNEPFATLLIEKANGVRIMSMDQRVPNFPAGYLIYGGLLTQKNTEAGDRYMIAYLRAQRDYRRAFGPEHEKTDEILAILRRYNIDVTPETPSLGIPEDGRPSLEGVDAFLDWQVKSGNVRQKPDPKTLIDDRFRAHAMAILDAAR